MQDQNLEDIIAAAQQMIAEEVAASPLAPTPPPVAVRIEPGSTAINVGNVTIGSQTIHQTAQPTKPKTP